MVNYATSDLEGCLEWLDSQELRGAIEDGVDRESQYPPLDGEAFIGNIYVPGEVVGGYRKLFGTHLVRRTLRVPKARWPRRCGPQNSCTSWPRSREWRLAVLAEYRDAPKRFPFDRYRSKGNRMISLELLAGADRWSRAGTKSSSPCSGGWSRNGTLASRTRGGTSLGTSS